MSLLAKRSITKDDKTNIITLGSIAKEMKKKNKDVVNATIGMYYQDNGKLATFDIVNETIGKLTDDEKYAYSSSVGNISFHEAIKKWVFQDNYDEIVNNNNVAVIASPGGSGAISNTFTNYLNINDKVLLPSFMWDNYKQFAYENNASYETYELFDNNGNFNLSNLKEKMVQLINEQGRVLLVINDPCHNPTGYCLKDNEWEELITLLNELSSDNTPIILLHDIAYIDYDEKSIKESRKNLVLYNKLNESVLVVLTFSASKTFALYGLRVGAQIALCKNKENIEEFIRANKYSSRAKWSNTTNLGMNLITKILNEDHEKFEKELNERKKVLTNRANTFIKECEKVNLKTLPFTCGFFITIPCKNPLKTYENLVQRDVHIIPLDNCIRITIASISLDECKKIPSIIKEELI